jgi:hypothetical protein
LNPARPELLARAHNQLKKYAKHTTADAEIVAGTGSRSTST